MTFHSFEVNVIVHPKGQRLRVTNGKRLKANGKNRRNRTAGPGYWVHTQSPKKPIPKECSVHWLFMLRPTYKEFQAYAKTATLVPVAKSISADLLTPVSAFLSFAEKEPYSFLLESVEGGEKIGRYTFLGANPYMRLTSDDDGVVLHRGRKQERIAGDAMQVIRRMLKQHKPADVPDLPPFTAGAVGFVSYDMVRRFERLPETAKKDVDVPECALMF